jgi:hypothetical protein
MKIVEIMAPQQQWTERTMGGFEIHKIKGMSGTGVGHLYSYNDENDEEVPVRIEFDFEMPSRGSWHEPAHGGMAEITKATTQDGQDIPVNSFKYDESNIIEAIGEYYEGEKSYHADNLRKRRREEGF